jgi:hypothetical protein
MKLLYFNSPDSFKAKVFVVPDNPQREGQSIFRHHDNSLTCGVTWNLSEMIRADWAMPPLRITRKQAESVMGNRKQFRKLVTQIRSRA